VGKKKKNDFFPGTGTVGESIFVKDFLFYGFFLIVIYLPRRIVLITNEKLILS